MLLRNGILGVVCLGVCLGTGAVHAQSAPAPPAIVPQTEQELLELIDSLSLDELIENLSRYRRIDKEGQELLRVRAQAVKQVERAEASIAQHMRNNGVRRFCELLNSPDGRKQLDEICQSYQGPALNRPLIELFKEHDIIRLDSDGLALMHRLGLVKREREAIRKGQEMIAGYDRDIQKHEEAKSGVQTPFLTGFTYTAGKDPLTRLQELEKAMSTQVHETPEEDIVSDSSVPAMEEDLSVLLREFMRP